MARKKIVEYIEMPFYLDGDVTITVRWPKNSAAGSVRRNASHNTFSIETGDGRTAIQGNGRDGVRHVNEQSPESNGPLTDTAEIIAQKEALLSRHPANRPYTTRDVFRDAGWGDEAPTGEQLEAAAEAFVGAV